MTRQRKLLSASFWKGRASVDSERVLWMALGVLALAAYLLASYACGAPGGPVT